MSSLSKMNEATSIYARNDEASGRWCISKRRYPVSLSKIIILHDGCHDPFYEVDNYLEVAFRN